MIVCFDLMGTVLVDPYRRALTAATQRPLTDVAARRDPTAWPAFERGELDEQEFARRFFLDGSPFDIETFHRVRRAGYRYLPGMREVLGEVSARARCVGATNYPVWIDEVAARFGLGRWLDQIWASCRLGVRKPDHGFYETMLAGLGVEASRCLFVDDREANCRAAADLGMAVHHFVGADDLRARLRADGLIGQQAPLPA